MTRMRGKKCIKQNPSIEWNRRIGKRPSVSFISKGYCYFNFTFIYITGEIEYVERFYVRKLDMRHYLSK